MKKLTFTTILCLLTLCAFAQKFAISSIGPDIIYVGLSTSISVAVEKYDNKSVVLQTKDAELTKMEDGSYELVAKEPGEIEIEVAVKDNGKIRVIGKYFFRAKSIPNPIARLAGKKCGSISKSILKAQIGISARFEDLPISGPALITSFYMIVIRENKTIFGHRNSGNSFNDRIRYFIPELQTGDKVFFVDIHCVNISKMDLQLTPLEFIIE